MCTEQSSVSPVPSSTLSVGTVSNVSDAFIVAVTPGGKHLCCYIISDVPLRGICRHTHAQTGTQTHMHTHTLERTEKKEKSFIVVRAGLSHMGCIMGQ